MLIENLLAEFENILNEEHALRERKEKCLMKLENAYEAGMVFYEPNEDIYLIIGEEENNGRYNIIMLDDKLWYYDVLTTDIWRLVTPSYVYVCKIDTQYISDLIKQYEEARKNIVSAFIEQHIRTETSSYSETVNHDLKGD